MKFIDADKGRLVIYFGRRERELLLQLLQLYPRMPPAHHKLSKSSQVDPSSQQLLDEALAEQRLENRRQLSAMLAQSGRWTRHESGWFLTLASGDLEWLLQVLNDIRVGSWVLVGCPEKHLETIDEHTAPHLWAMEIAGSFQMAFLHLLDNRP